MKDALGQLPDRVIADAGYGSEENYKYLEDNGVEAYIKYSPFHKQGSKKWRENPQYSENLHYNEEKDSYYCPMGQQMTLKALFSLLNGYKSDQ